MIVKFSHLHESEDDHSHAEDHAHHESHPTDENVDLNEVADDDHGQSQETQHTHEIAVSCGHVMFSPAFLLVPNHPFDQLQFPIALDSAAPRSRILESLFRPPIRA